MVEQVGEGIIAVLEGTGGLSSTVVDGIHRIADRASEVITPSMVIEGHNAEQGEYFCITGTCAGANVGRTVIQVVADSLAVDQLETDGVVLDLIVPA